MATSSLDDRKLRTVRKRRIDLYKRARREFKSRFEDLVREAAPVTVDNVEELESQLVDLEFGFALQLINKLVDLHDFPCSVHQFVSQTGATCMSTSLANGMIAFGETFFDQPDRVERVHNFTQHLVNNTSGFGKPHEYRSVDDLHKYLKRQNYLEYLQGYGASEFDSRYHLELTNSLLDVVVALHSGEGKVVVQSHAHAQLAFELFLDGDTPCIRQRDPFMVGDSEQHRVLSLEQWRQSFFWSPLRKIPTTMGRGFDSLGAEEILSHLARYEEMDNLGLECISGILVALPIF